MLGYISKRAGTTIVETAAYSKIFSFNNKILKLNATNLTIESTTIPHLLTDISNIKVISTKNRCFILEPLVALHELRYYPNTNTYDYLPFEFTHPALQTNIESESPGTSITLSALEGSNIMITATLYAPFNVATQYYLDDVFLVEKSFEAVTAFRVKVASAIGIQPIDESYNPINLDVYERINASQWPTYINGNTYNFGDRVYYQGDYYICFLNGTTTLPTTSPDWSFTAYQDETQSIFRPNQVGSYVKVNNTVFKIKQVLTKFGTPSTQFSVNTKLVGDIVGNKATANTAVKDSWFVSKSAFINLDDPSKLQITDITMIQQRLVISTIDGVYFSEVADYNNFLLTDITLTAQPFDVKVFSTLTTAIKYITPWRNGIIVHTDRTLIYVFSDNLLSALNVRAVENVYFPVSEARPIQVQGSVMYISQDKLRGTTYSEEAGGLISIAINDHFPLKENILKIVSHINTVYLLTDSGFVYAYYYDKNLDLKIFTKYTFAQEILDLANIDDILYLLTEDKLIKLDPTKTTDNSTGTLNNGVTYPLEITTNRIDISAYKRQATSVDQVQTIKDVVCHVQNTSNLVINNKDTEIVNNFTGSIRVYEDKKVSTTYMNDGNNDAYRINIKSESPYSFKLLAITLNVT